MQATTIRAPGAWALS